MILFLQDYATDRYFRCMYFTKGKLAVIPYSLEIEKNIIAELNSQKSLFNSFGNIRNKLAYFDKAKTIVLDFFEKNKAESAYSKLEALGIAAIPAMISLMNDYRELSLKQISLSNKSTNAFEAVRHYGPDLVIDVIDAIINQITGYSFGSIHNGDLRDYHRNFVYECWVIWLLRSPEMREYLP